MYHLWITFHVMFLYREYVRPYGRTAVRTGSCVAIASRDKIAYVRLYVQAYVRLKAEKIGSAGDVLFHKKYFGFRYDISKFCFSFQRRLFPACHKAYVRPYVRIE